MYEKFTDRSRKVMQLANQEAQRFNHEYVGTEHVLIALVKEGNGVAAHVLRNRGIDITRIRLEVEKHIAHGPDMVTMGKLPQTPRCKKAIEAAIDEAQSLGHGYVGTEHLLLGLLRDPDEFPVTLLRSIDIEPAYIRRDVLDLLGQGVGETPIGPEPQPQSVTVHLTIELGGVREKADRELLECAARASEAFAVLMSKVIAKR